MKKQLRSYGIITVGSVIFALSFDWFFAANAVGMGGITGLAQVLNVLFPALSVGIGTILLNVPLFLAGWKFIGFHLLASSLFSMTVSSLAMDGIALLYTFSPMDPMLASICGGAMMGAGLGIVFSQGATTGGTDIVAMIINKYRTVSYGKILIYSDFVIIASALLVGMGISAVIYGYVMTAVVGYTVDMIMAGNQQSSQVFIVTHDYEKMAQAIVDNVHRGVTLIDSQGWYSKKESKIVMVVCRKRETAMILKFVKTIDPEAFMTVGSVMGVYGKGFQAIGKG